MIDDDLRAVMREHDSEAPSAADFLARHNPAEARLRKKRWIASGAAAACVVAIAVVISITGLPAEHRPTSFPHGSGTSVSVGAPALPPGLACPKHVQDSNTAMNGWVPADPQTRNPAKALVPHATPQGVVVCSYTGHFIVTGPKADSLSHATLAGTRALSGDLRSVTVALRRVPKGPDDGCLQYLSPTTDSQYYLIGLSFRGKTDWVAVPGDHCKGSTNGVYNSHTNLRADTAQAYTYGVWDSDPTVLQQCHARPAAVAPAALRTDPTSLTVCYGVTPTVPRRVFRYPSADPTTVTTYNKYAARTHARACPLDFSPIVLRLAVRFGYADGSSSVLTGSNGCIQGPGGVVITGVDAKDLIATFTRDLIEHQ